LWDSEPGTNPAFLYQQNTLRDAVSAGIFLNAFNEHCYRVRMANIAQTNNVLQAMILTKGEKMIVTPTYHVFEMYKVHQGATYLPSDLSSDTYRYDGQELPMLVCSASKDKAGKIQLSICNINPKASAELICEVRGATVKSVTGRVLTASKMNTHNTFDEPNTVKPTILEGIKLEDGQILATLPSKSVVVLTIE